MEDVGTDARTGRKVRRGRGLAIVAGASLLVGMLALPTPAAASHSTPCGYIVPASATHTLHSDVGPCTGTAIHMSNGSTLDLNGYRIVGANNIKNAVDGDVGIKFGGVTGATVTDSNTDPQRSNAVTGFDAGIAIVNGAGNTVEKVNVAGNVGLDGDHGEGVHVNGSSTNTVRNNKFSENGPYSAISLSNNSDGNTVQGNTIAANTVTHQDIAIRLESWDAASPCPDNNVVDNNVIVGNTLDGISILNGKACNATGNTLSNNKISGHARDGIRLNARLFLDLGLTGECRGAAGTQVYGNVTVGNAGAGIRATACVGNSYIHDNTSVDNNPDVAPAVVNSPLLPPHGDLHDNNPDCTPSRPGTGGVNKWGGDDPSTTAVEADNVHVTEYAPPGSAATIPFVDYVCVK